MNLEKELYIKDRYLQILSTNANLTELCNFTASCIGNPVAITLTTKTIIAKSSDYTSDLVKEYTDAPAMSSPEEREELNQELDKELGKRQPVVRTWPYLSHKRINCGCFWRCVMLAVIDCPITKTPVNDEMLQIIGIAAPIFLSALRLNSYVDVNTVDPVETFMIGLLRGEINRENMHKYLSVPEILSTKEWHIMQCKPLNDASHSEIKSVINSICSYYKGLWCVEFNHNVILLMDASCTSLFEKLHDACEPLCQIAVSVPFDDIITLPEHLDDTYTILQLAEFAEDYEPIIFAQKYQIVLELLAMLKSNKNNIVNPILNEIKLYDKEHASSYYATLKSYLLHNRDYQLMSESLHIHKNTVTYRMQKICELFEINLKDNSLLTSLYLSLFADF